MIIFPKLLTPPYDHTDPQPLTLWRSKIKGPVEYSADLSRYIRVYPSPRP